MGCVRFDGHGLECGKELLTLAKEESIGGKAGDSCYSSSEPIVQRADDRDVGKVGANEFTGDGEDQAGLDQRGWLERGIGKEIGEGEAGVRHGSNGRLNAIARKIDPFEEVSDLIAADAEGDFQNLRVFHFLAHDRVQAGAALLDVSKVKRSRVSDHLNVVRVVEICIRDGNGGAVADLDCLGIGCAEIGVGGAPITNEPTRIDIEVHEIGEAADVLRSRCLAALKDAELIEVDRLGAFRLQVRIEKGCVAHFVQRVAGDVLRAIGVKVGERSLVGVQRVRLVGVYFNGRIVTDSA